MTTQEIPNRFHQISYRDAATLSSTSTVKLHWRLIAFCLLHIPIALIMMKYPHAAKLQAAVTLSIGFLFAARGRLLSCAYVVAYIAGAEVLWRMTGGSLTWEIGKQATCAILITAMMVRCQRVALLPFLYVILLLPSALFTIFELPFEDARKELSFNLSGPISLAVAVAFFSRIRMSAYEIRRLLTVMVAPVFGIAAIAIFGILTASSLEFTTESNRATSGGFGPNQVSSALGMGAAYCFLLLLSVRGGMARAFLLASVVVFAAQSMLTFSRNGIYLALSTAFVATFLMMRDRRARQVTVFGGSVVILLWLLVLPRLDNFTQGQLGKRFGDAGDSGRLEVLQTQLMVWQQRPIFGVGPGMSKSYQEQWFGTRLAAHTEYARMLSEHGIFGLGALILLCWMGVRAIRRASNSREFPLVAATLIFAMLYLAVNGMRIVLPSFLFGFAFVRGPIDYLPPQFGTRNEPLPAEPKNV